MTEVHQEELPDPVVAGVPLSAYAAVVAFVVEGIELDAALQHQRIPRERWAEVERSWKTALRESAFTEDDPLGEAFDLHRIAAHGRVERRLPPLDEDYAAYVTFFRHFSVCAEPWQLLASLDLNDNDVFRLQALWQRRIAEDEDLQRKMGEAWQAPLGPLPEVHPEPARLPVEDAAG